MSEQVDYQILKWDPETIRRFWDFAAKWEPWQNDYFSKQVGSGIVKFLSCVLPLKGRIVDFGCGPGYLVEHLLNRGICCEGIDYSSDSVEAINKRFSGHVLWAGAKAIRGSVLPFDDDSIDLMLCVETLEHVLPDEMEGLLSEFRRVVKPRSGRLFITVPNAEDLASNLVYCVVCGSLAHRYQHVSSYTAESLGTLLATNGFITIASNITNFDRFQKPIVVSPLDWSPRYLLKSVLRFWDHLLGIVLFSGESLCSYRLKRFIGHGPHLFWLGAKE